MPAFAAAAEGAIVHIVRLPRDNRENSMIIENSGGMAAAFFLHSWLER